MTGRLIDADALKAQLQREIDIYFDEDGGGIHTAMEARDEIDYAPTVDAIPVEWIRKYTEENRLYQSDDFDLYISDMIADWEERKEE
jgi:hypothetical protein